MFFYYGILFLNALRSTKGMEDLVLGVLALQLASFVQDQQFEQPVFAVLTFSKFAPIYNHCSGERED